MPDKARARRELQEEYLTPLKERKEVQDDEKQIEQYQELPAQNRVREPYYQTKFVKWPLLIGSAVLLLLLLAIGYFYGSGAVDEVSSVLLALALTLLVTAVSAAFWWFQRDS